MKQEPDWQAIREERAARIKRVLSQPFDAAWVEVRAVISEATPTTELDEYPRIYTGPTRSFLRPLPWELLHDFIKSFGTQALDVLFTCAEDPNPILAAYALHALSEYADPRLAAAAGSASTRTEMLSFVYGCFVDTMPLAEYAKKLTKEAANES